VVTGLEAHFFISGGEGDPVEGGGPSYSYLLYECLQAPKDPLCGNKSMMMRFFWGHKEKEKRIHWLSWSKLSLSKA
jgi:hypothetical protein